ncbi:MAG: hypothetical protein COB67_02270 [SAR324 cluster bacterium]|uniref:CN hydrolase domain-containing protein n=1 Tax=SAR324 cluster bacterium TaxID=2024889 RepID=A0A2A4T9M7_9DELT|nr:MAG: hypothetical protein COB67_02270 [SAR324 cluster bacterium]
MKGNSRTNIKPLRYRKTLKPILEVLKEQLFFSEISCPYELFVALYHIGLPFEEKLINLSSQPEGNVFMGDLISQPLMNQNNEFSLYTVLEDLIPQIDDEIKAQALLIALLSRLDNFLAGIDSDEFQFSTDVSERLRNPNYYSPIIPNKGLNPAIMSYQIIPQFPPVYQEWMGESSRLSQDSGYFSSTLAGTLLEHHCVIQNKQVDSKDILFINQEDSHILSNFYRSLEGLEDLTIGLAACDEGFHPVVKTSPGQKGKVGFQYTEMQSPITGGVQKRLNEILEESLSQAVNILIFPELTIDAGSCEQIKNWLQERNDDGIIRLVVAGSFHYMSQEGHLVNRAIMLDGFGNELWTHDKQKAFKLTDHNITSCQKKLRSKNKDGNLRDFFGLQAGDCLEEPIWCDSPITFVDTPIGRMSTLICLDYLLPKIGTILGRVPCHYLWVPIMAFGARDFHHMAKDDYGKKHAVLTACCASISCCEILQGNNNNLSFLYAPSLKFKAFPKTPQGTASKHPALQFYRLRDVL